MKVKLFFLSGLILTHVACTYASTSIEFEKELKHISHQLTRAQNIDPNQISENIELNQPDQMEILSFEKALKMVVPLLMPLPFDNPDGASVLNRFKAEKKKAFIEAALLEAYQTNKIYTSFSLDLCMSTEDVEKKRTQVLEILGLTLRHQRGQELRQANRRHTQNNQITKDLIFKNQQLKNKNRDLKNKLTACTEALKRQDAASLKQSEPLQKTSVPLKKRMKQSHIDSDPAIQETGKPSADV